MGENRSLEVKFGISPNIYPIDLIFKAAETAERAGLDGLWMADHVVAFGVKRFNALNAWAVLSALAAKTKQIKLCTSVSDPHRIHPATLAQIVNTVDVISGGRVVLGIGAGEAMNLDPFHVQWDKPVDRMAEAIEVMKKLWTEERVQYEGRFFHLHEAILEPKPIQKPHPPIWIAGNSPRTIRIAAELGDGWLPMAAGPQRYRENLARLREDAEKKGRDPKDIVPAIFLYIGVAKDRETAKKFFEVPAKVLAITQGMDEVVKKLGHEPFKEYNFLRHLLTKEKARETLERAISIEVTFEKIQDILPCPIGIPDECVKVIEEYVKAGVRYFVLVPLTSSENFQEVYELCINEVIPQIKEV